MAWNEPGGNDKDPWGHRKNEDGPPDLDEVIKKMQDKLNNMFGNKKGGGNDGGDSNDNSGGDGISWTALVVIVLTGLIIWALFGFYIVQPAEQGVVTRFGAYNQTTTQGLHWHFPSPIEEVEIVNVEEVRAVTHEALMLTQDENIIKIKLVVQYRVKDAKDYLFNIRDPDSTLHQATESALREIVGTSKMDDVLTSERARVAADTKVLIQDILNRYVTGLTVISVNMQDAQPPNEVQEAFADVIKAREDEERYKNQAQAYANEVVQRAKGLSDKLREESLAYKAQAIAKAEGETQRFLQVLTEYEKAPEITRQRLYLETMEQVLGSTNKIMMDVDSGNNLMLLPLDKLMNSNPRTINPQSITLPNSQPQPIIPSYSQEDERGRRSREDARERGGRANVSQ
ncbi:FtsH protease activity modulator HflK [Candidatus Albibeggiatoa sp. nov. NOAA]|uniref:FtsH protease activity modulator HflK n=1 Tax=Candidatus Albibeggiatoa sp. nov. NOAA TaxID=3162724 RepID=UPI0033034E94|nr:FtsH protease activity modulator HflK [Thiotrichaceae bacterium]